MSSMPWIKLYTEMLDDPKIGRLADAIKWRFVSLVLLAGECDQDGAFITGQHMMSIDDIAWRLRITREQCETELEALLQCGVLELDGDVYYLPKFSDRQGRPQSEKREQWRERKQRQRESQKTQESVTRDSRVIHAPRVEKSREEKNREEKSSADKPRKPQIDKTPLLIETTSKDLQASLIKAYSGKGRSAPIYFSNEQQRDQFSAAIKALGGQSAALIDKGLGRDRLALAQLLAWLEACVKNQNGNGQNGNGHAPQTSIDDEHAAALKRAYR